MVVPTRGIDADSESIESVFKNFYSVPDFQREYVWKQRHVKKLLEDLHTAFMSKEVDSYFLGSIVFYEKDETFQLVDGQQRMATLFILMSAIRDRVKALDEGANLDVYENAIKASFKPRGGGVAYQYRVILQYPEISEVLQQIGDGKADEIVLPPGESPRRNLITAYQLCAEFFRDRFGDDADRLDQFFTFVWKDVELIIIHTEDMRRAFTIFETINDRGVGLDAMDLLKNLLFRQTTEASARQQLTAKWKELLRVLREGGETKPIRFLRYYLIATFEFERVPTARALFDWMVAPENRRKLGYGANPVVFAEALLTAADSYANFALGRDVRGDPNWYLEAINYQKTGVRQHLCLLLAARLLSQRAFNELCRWLETLVFVFAVTSAQWNEIERLLPRWTRSLRAARSAADVMDFVADEVRPVIDTRVDLLMAKLEDTSTIPERLKKYLLAALTQFLEEQCGKGGTFDRYFTEKLTIEHILPVSTTMEEPNRQAKKWVSEFGASTEPGDYVHRLGNLTLLHRVPNSSARDDAFATKLDWYRKSTYDLTRSIAENISGGKNTKLTRTFNKYDLRPFQSWDPESLERRHRMLLQMMGEYWEIPLV